MPYGLGADKKRDIYFYWPIKLINWILTLNFIFVMVIVVLMRVDSHLNILYVINLSSYFKILEDIF